VRALLRAAAAGAALVAVAGCGAGQGSTTPSAPAASSAPPGAPTVVGLGDSVMSGTNCECAGITAEYATAMGQRSGTTIRPIGRGVGGYVTSDLAADLATAETRRTVGEARVVLVVIGANDLLPQLALQRQSGCPASCYVPAVNEMGARLRGLLAAIDRARGQTRGPVLVSDYWNVFQDGDTAREENGDAEVQWSRAVSREANTAICAAASAEGAICVDTYGPFLAGDNDPDEYLASDGDHPNAAGVQLIVRRLVAATPPGTF
jgi:lysophospholipase L1-like esterase